MTSTKKYLDRKFGFTLVELLVVLAIISIIVVVLFGVGYQNTRKAAIDSKKRADLNSFRVAIQQYGNEKGRYPISASDVEISSATVCSTLGIDKFIPSCPVSTDTTGAYYYRSTGDGSEYCVWTSMQRSGDCFKYCSSDNSGSYPEVSGECSPAAIGGVTPPGPSSTPSLTPAASTPTPSRTPTPTTAVSTPTPSMSPTPTATPAYPIRQNIRTGIANGPTLTVSSSSFTSTTNTLYIASIADNGVGISSVTGLGLTWSQVMNHCSGAGPGRIFVYKAYSGATVNTGTVTATFNANANSAAIAVTSYLNASSTIGNKFDANKLGQAGLCNDTGSFTSSYSFNIINASANSVIHGSINGLSDITDHNPNSPLVERNERTVGNGAGATSLSIVDGAFVNPQAVNTAGSFSTGRDWTLIFIEILPGT